MTSCSLTAPMGFWPDRRQHRHQHIIIRQSWHPFGPIALSK